MLTICHIHRRRPTDTWKVRLKLGERVHAFETGTTSKRKAEVQAVATRRAIATVIRALKARSKAR